MRIGALYVAVAACLWGLWPIWVRGEAGGEATVAIAMGVAGLCALPLALRAGRARRGARRNPLPVALLGALNAINAWLYFRALDEGSVAPAALSHYLAPVLVAITAPLVLREPSSRRTPPALLLALAGSVALLLPADGEAHGAARHAALLGGASAVFYAATILLGKRLVLAWSNAELFSYHALVIAAMLAPLVPLPADPSAWLRPAAGGLVSGFLPGMLYYAGLRRLPAERAGVLCYLELASASLVGWAVFGEQPSAWAAAGGAAIVAAGWLVLTAPVNQRVTAP